ncbi:MAG: 5-methylcytosine-specific restriction protein B [Oleispira sp.]|jgi:5-methylcytosine-specific restriction protein B
MTRKKITEDQISAIWPLAYAVKAGTFKYDDALEEAVSKHGLNESSAKIYLNNLSCIFEGRIFKRAMSARSFEIYWDETVKLGAEAQEKYLRSVSEHLEYNSNKKALAFVNEKRREFGLAALTFVAKIRKIKTEGKEIVITVPTNRILYGPPGTGKTYSVAEEVVTQLEPAFEWETREELQQQYQYLLDAGQVVFTTFHQSFSYEEFVEGIRAKTSEHKKISYEIEPGIFKALCEKAGKFTVTGKQHLEGGVGNRKIWKLSLGNTLVSDEASVYEYCKDNDCVLLGWGDDINFSGRNDREAVFKALKEKDWDVTSGGYPVQVINTFKNIISKDDLIIISHGNHKYRGIAVVEGDYEFLEDNDDRASGFHQSRKVRWLAHYEPARPKENIFKKDLSQRTLYQLHDETIDREKLEVELSDDASEEQDKDYVIVIDEINRGNISKIFGELITLIEPSKREGQPEALSVTLPYSKTSFSVPSNLHIIGTMNTADRSLALLDTALRRRFDFIEMMPDYDVLKNEADDNYQVKGINLALMLKAMNDRIEYLYDREHTLGHAFLMPVVELIKNGDEGKAFEELKSVFMNKILPLLEEYFYEDWSKITLVLGDNQKDSTALIEQRFVVEQAGINVSALFGRNHAIDDYGIENKCYQLNTAMQDFTVAAFIAIYDVDKAKSLTDKLITSDVTSEETA